MQRKEIEMALKGRTTEAPTLDVPNNKTQRSTPKEFEISIDIPSKQIKGLPDWMNLSISNTLDNLQKIQEKYLEHKNNLSRELVDEERRLQVWDKQMEAREKLRNHLFYTVKDNEPIYLSGSEAERAEDEVFIPPYFECNPSRFDRQKVSLPAKSDYFFTHKFKKVKNVYKEHTQNKKHLVWSIDEIKAFVLSYFRTPNKFTEIKEHLPNKSVKEVIQFFYFVKYEFKLKYHLRLLYKAKDDYGLIEKYTEKIVKKISKIFTQKWISVHEIAAARKEKKSTTSEEYFEIYGKDKKKIGSEDPHYHRFKQWAWGDAEVQDEGNFRMTRQSSR